MHFICTIYFGDKLYFEYVNDSYGPCFQFGPQACKSFHYKTERSMSNLWNAKQSYELLAELEFSGITDVLKILLGIWRNYRVFD